MISLRAWQAFEREEKADWGGERSARGARGRREGTRSPLPSPSRAVSHPNSHLLPFRTPATQAIMSSVLHIFSRITFLLAAKIRREKSLKHTRHYSSRTGWNSYSLKDWRCLRSICPSRWNFQKKSRLFCCAFWRPVSLQRKEKKRKCKRDREGRKRSFFLSLHLRYPRLFPPPLTLAPEVRSQNKPWFWC